MPADDCADWRSGGMTRRRARECDACSRARNLDAVTITFAFSFDGTPRHRTYAYLCDDCRLELDKHDESLGPTLKGALCTFARAMVTRARRA